MDQAKRAGMIMTAENAKVTGEASLRIDLAAGLRPVGGVQNKGEIFKKIELNRGGLPYADTQA